MPVNAAAQPAWKPLKTSRRAGPDEFDALALYAALDAQRLGLRSSTFTVPSGRSFDVGRLQIPMDDALLVCRFERLRNLLRNSPMPPAPMAERISYEPRRVPACKGIVACGLIVCLG